MTCSTTYCLCDTLADPWNVCIYAHICVCMYVCMHVFVCAYTHVRMNLFMYVRADVHS